MNNPTRDAHAAATRAEILAQARALFIAHGYETVTIRQIAKASGKSTGALFAHWAGKDELFTEAMGRPPFTDAMGERLWLWVAEVQGRATDYDCQMNALAIAKGPAVPAEMLTATGFRLDTLAQRLPGGPMRTPFETDESFRARLLR